MSGLVLRFAGPLQSWGEHSRFGERDTVAFPTRSGLVGICAAAMGRQRHEPLDIFTGLRMTVRVDSPGVPLTDFHTVGGGLPPARTVPIADGKHRGGANPNANTIVSRRRYLSDAVFVVAVTGPTPLLDTIGPALLAPRWQPYLGRRSCPPDQPFVLATHSPDPEHDLRTRVPVPRRPHLRNVSGYDVDLISEVATSHDADDAGAAVAELDDAPTSFADLDRRYSRRRVARQVITLDPALVRGIGPAYQNALAQYIEEER